MTPTPPHPHPMARHGTLEEQFQRLSDMVGELLERGTPSGEHPTPEPTPPQGAWERWGRWVTVGSVIAGALWWIIAQSGWSPVSPKDELTKVSARIDTVKAQADTLSGDVADLKLDMRFMTRVVCRELVKDPDLADSCNRQGLQAAPPRR